MVNKSLGQHWLYNRAILEEIADLASRGVNEESAYDFAEKTGVKIKRQICLEIGPGLGTLTSSLLKRFEKVVAVEFDARLAENLPKSFPGKNLEIINDDILKFDFSQIKETYVVVGNIPYYITSPIIEKILTVLNKPERIVLLMQKEVVERILDVKGSVLSLFVKNSAKVFSGPVVLRAEFTPPPKVDSQVIILEPLDEPEVSGEVFSLIRAGFKAPRKKLVTNLASFGSREELKNIFQDLGISIDARPADLGLKDWEKLDAVLKNGLSYKANNLWYNEDMLDVKFIRENFELVERSTKEKGYKINIREVLDLDDKRKKELVRVEELRRRRNEIAAKMKGGKPEASLIEEGKKVKEEIAGLEVSLEKVEAEVKNRLKAIPNIIFEDVPLGGEEDSVEVKSWGEKKVKGVDHLDYAVSRDWVDFERGAKVAGAKFYYLKNELALLENALIQFGLKKVLEKGFNFITVPDLVSSKVLEGTGFNPRSSEQSDEYFIEGEDLALIATAEIALTGYHMDEIIDEKDLPFKYAGLSACFRKEAGAAGKHTRGLFRVHQFNKLEMYIFCLPEKSKSMHEEILAIEEEIWQELGIPYRVINIAAGDLGAPAAKKYDVEYWSPVDQKYREITSCSNCTDFQARNLNIRVRRADGSVEVLHTLNGTAVSLARTMVAVIENYAVSGGKLKVPEVLKPYLNNKEEI